MSDSSNTKSTLKFHITAGASFPFYTKPEDSAWQEESGEKIVLLRTEMNDYPQLSAQLDEMRSTYQGFIKNGSFELPAGGEQLKPSHWDGDFIEWDKAQREGLPKTEIYPDGFVWWFNQPALPKTGEIPWKVVRAETPLLKRSTSTKLIHSEAFTLPGGEEYTASVSYMAKNGRCDDFLPLPVEPPYEVEGTETNPVVDGSVGLDIRTKPGDFGVDLPWDWKDDELLPPDEPEPPILEPSNPSIPPGANGNYVVEIIPPGTSPEDRMRILINQPPRDYGNPRHGQYKMEPEYGAILVYSNDDFVSDKRYVIVGVGRGETTYSSGGSTGNPIWKTFTTSFELPSGSNYTCYFYLYNRFLRAPEHYYEYERPWVMFDYVTLNEGEPYIYQTIDISLLNKNTDSIFNFSVDSPEVRKEELSLELLARTNTATGCRLIITSGSETTTEYGFHTPGLLDSNNSSNLFFGKDDDEKSWLSWISFNADPIFALTEGVRVTSASLVLTTTKDVPSTPERTAYVTVGFEESCGRNSIEPTPPTSYETIDNKRMAEHFNTAILNSAITGGSLEIDITNKLKSFVGNKAFQWGSIGDFSSVLKDNNSSIGGYRQFASGSHLGYPSPKIKINYVRNGKPKKVMTVPLVENEPSKPFWNYIYNPIGGKKTDPDGMKQSRMISYFDLSSLPSGSITHAELCIHFSIHEEKSVIPPGENQTLQVYGVKEDDPWDYYGVAWGQRFGAGSSKGWTDNNHYGQFPLFGSKSNITMADKGDWIKIPFTDAGLVQLNAMKNGTRQNNGFIIRDSRENSPCRVSYTSSNHTNISKRPRLKLWINGVIHEIFYPGPSEDPTDWGQQPPDDPPGTPGGSIELINTQWIENAKPNQIYYSLKGDKNTNRYLLIGEGSSAGNNQGYGYDNFFKTMMCNGAQMTAVAEHLWPSSDEACGALWGLVIPNDWEKNVNLSITGDIHEGGGRKRHWLFVREFNNVDPNNPIFSTVKRREGANSAISNGPTPLQIEYKAGGFVADLLFLANDEINLGVPSVVHQEQTMHQGVYRYGFSYFKPGENDGVVGFNWKWKRYPNVEGGDPAYPNSGSDNLLLLVSLNPS